MKNVLNDPNLVGKLHEKRQELYGDFDAQRASVSSSESFNPMENYEEVCFDLVGTADSSSEDENAPSNFSRVTNMTLPPRRHNIGSAVAMLQCQPEEKKAQAYLSFQPSPSHSPLHSGSEPEFSASEHLSPNVYVHRGSSESQPPLPPRGAERMREGSPRLVRKALPPVTDRTIPPKPPVRSQTVPQTEKYSQEDSHRTTRVPFGQHPQAVFSSSDAPPPPPQRNVSRGKDVSPPPQPPSRRDLHVPMPLPKDAKSSQPQPPSRHHHQLPNVNHVSRDAEIPPPVPVRQSGGGSRSTSNIGQAPPTRSISGDDAPPVPSRGARQRDIHSTPSLQRPHSTPSSDTQPQVKPRTPIRPTHVGEVNSQQPAPAWDGVTGKPPVTKPRPPVASKPHPPPVSVKPSVSSKPQPNAKPPVGARNTATKPPPLPVSRKPPRTVPSSQQNGEFAPPVPPR